MTNETDRLDLRRKPAVTDQVPRLARG